MKEGSEDYIDVNASTGLLTIKKNGTATVIVSAAETRTYAQKSKEVTVTINKANAVTATVTANNRAYVDRVPLVNVSGEVVGGTMNYAIGEDDYNVPVDGWSTEIPTATSVGTYFIWYKAVADEFYIDTSPVCVIVEITKANSEAAIVNPNNRTYDGTEQPLVTINQAKLQNKLMTLRRTLIPSIFEEFIDEEQDVLNDTNKPEASEDKEIEEVKDTQNNSDEEEVTEDTQNSYTDEQNQNDNEEEGEQKDSEIKEEIIIKNAMLIKEILTPVDVDTEENQQEEENDDKEVEEKDDEFVDLDETIEETDEETTEKSIDEKLEDKTKDSTSEELKQESEKPKEETQEESTITTEENVEKPIIALKAMKTVRLLQSTPTENPGLKFALGRDSASAPSEGWSTNIPKAKNAGTYYVWHKVVGDSNHYDTEETCVTVIISKATATITAKNQTITVGDTVPSLNSLDLYNVSGLFGNDKLIKAPTLTYQKNGESVLPDNTKADSYDIVPSGASAGANYNITYAKGTLTISESARAVAEIVPSSEPSSIIVDALEISNGLAEQAEEMAKDGDRVELKLVVTPKGESDIAESEALNQAPQMKLQVESQFKEENTVKVDVIDIDIKQIINGATQENLKETNAVLEIAIGYDFTGKYDPVVIRGHEGNAKTFKALDARQSADYEDGTYFADVENNKIYLYSRYFSTYVIAYSTVEGNATNREPVATTTSSGGETNQPEVSTIPVYRLFNLKKGYHFFTSNAAEKEALVAAGWTDEGVAWQVQPNVGAPVYRLFDKAKGMHIFTVDEAEKDALIAAGASDEGIAWYAPTNIGRIVYKITNPKVNNDLYTISTAEKDALVATGFTVEEAKFKAY